LRLKACRTEYLTLSGITHAMHTSALHFCVSLWYNTEYREMLYKTENAIV